VLKLCLVKHRNISWWFLCEVRSWRSLCSQELLPNSEPGHWKWLEAAWTVKLLLFSLYLWTVIRTKIPAFECQPFWGAHAFLWVLRSSSWLCLSFFLSFFKYFFITYFPQLHFQCSPKSPPYPPPPTLPYPPISIFWPWRSPVLRHIQFVWASLSSDGRLGHLLIHMPSFNAHSSLLLLVAYKCPLNILYTNVLPTLKSHESCFHIL
jgi:hypothetical protein